MARRDNKNTSNNQSTPEVPKEDTVSTTNTEAPASTETKPAEADAPIDVSAFLAAVEKAVTDDEARDATTGELPEALIDPVNAEFRKLDGAKAKNAARKQLNELMKTAMNELKMPLARSYMILADKLSASGGGSTKESTPKDPTEAFVARIVGLQLATELAKANVPEGVDEGWSAKANELYTSSKDSAAALFAYVNDSSEEKGDEPEASAVVKAAVKLAQGKAAKVGGGSSRAAGDGVRRDIGKHIASAFEGVESGKFLTIAEIRAHKSAEYDGVEPSAGAISARLFPSSGKPTSVEGVTAGTVDGKKGATKN